MNFLTTANETDTDLYPRQDPEVLRLEGVLREAREALAPAAQAWKDYGAAHCDESMSVPFSRQKQRLYDTFGDRSLDVEDAEAALKPVVDAAMQRATAVWNDRAQQRFLDDQPAIEQFIAVLERHEQLVTEAQAVGVTHGLKVPHVFLTSEEVRTRLAYAKKELGLT